MSLYYGAKLSVIGANVYLGRNGGTGHFTPTA